jgi:hypothetical protein
LDQTPNLDIVVEPLVSNFVFGRSAGFVDFSALARPKA